MTLVPATNLQTLQTLFLGFNTLDEQLGMIEIISDKLVSPPRRRRDFSARFGGFVV